MATLGQGLMARGWQVALASAGRTGDHNLGPEWFSQQGIDHFLIPFPLKTRRLQTTYDFARSAVSTNLIARHYRPDIMHVHWRSTSPYAQLVSKIQKVPFVTSLRLEGIPAGHLQRGLSFWGERTIAISTETHQYLVQTFGVPPAKIRTIYHGVDETHFRPPTGLERNKMREELQLAPEDFVVCLIGRLADKKGHDILIKALAKLKSQGVYIKALFAGEGGRENYFRQLALEAGVDDLVQFLGFREVRGILWASDVIVLPSRIEGFAPAAGVRFGSHSHTSSWSS
jgi:glycosyltransferase involved in cell wall biosynthesis